MEVTSVYVAVQSQCRCERLYSVIGRYDICEFCRETLVRQTAVTSDEARDSTADRKSVKPINGFDHAVVA